MGLWDRAASQSQEGVAVPVLPQKRAGAGLLGPSCLVCLGRRLPGGGVKAESWQPPVPTRDGVSASVVMVRPGVGQNLGSVSPRQRAPSEPPLGPLHVVQTKTRQAPSRAGPPLLPWAFPPLTYNVPDGGAPPEPGPSLLGLQPPGLTPPPPDLCGVQPAQEDRAPHARPDSSARMAFPRPYW